MSAARHASAAPSFNSTGEGNEPSGSRRLPNIPRRDPQQQRQKVQSRLANPRLPHCARSPSPPTPISPSIEPSYSQRQKALVERWEAEGRSTRCSKLTTSAKEGRPEPRGSDVQIHAQNEERGNDHRICSVSTDGQTLDAQQSALPAAGAERVYSEKVSGAVTDRKALAKAILALGPGDVLLVTRLDRLPRSTRDPLNVLDPVGKAGAGFRSLADAWASPLPCGLHRMRTLARHHDPARKVDADGFGCLAEFDLSES